MIATSTMTQNPDIPESHSLRGWYDSSGNNASFQSHTGSGSFSGGAGGGFTRSEIKPLLEMKLEANGIPESEEKPMYFSTKATIMHIRGENIAYAACEVCNKKVVEEGGSWRCEKCDKAWPKPVYRCVYLFKSPRLFKLNFFVQIHHDVRCLRPYGPTLVPRVQRGWRGYF